MGVDHHGWCFPSRGQASKPARHFSFLTRLTHPHSHNKTHNAQGQTRTTLWLRGPRRWRRCPNRQALIISDSKPHPP